MNPLQSRKEYRLSALGREELAVSPLAQFQKWFQEVADAGALEPHAMTLATVDGDGKPSSRIVLLRGAEDRGFTFFTNYESRKGRELEKNPHASLTFFWAVLERQVSVRGKVARVSTEESKKYFHSRPRDAQLGAWVSRQSSVIPSHQSLEDELASVSKKFEGMDVPLPPYWGGYLLTPETLEFWQGRPNRLHDRFRYARQPAGDWLIERLAP